MPQIRTIRILVVEDNPGYLFLVQHAFKERGEHTKWDLKVAGDGEEALRILFEEEAESAPLPDMILLDWNLPKVSGGEVLHRVKLDRKLRRIPILVFSSSEAEEDIQAAYDQHANGYITKPSSSEELAAVVETVERFWVALAKLPKVLR